MIRERELGALPGLPMAPLFFVVLCGLVYALIASAAEGSVVWIVALSIAILLDVLLFMGLFVVNPNEGRVLQLFGDYVGTVRRRGCAGRTPSTPSGGSRCASGTSRAPQLKVNDSDGNPIEIAAVVVWRVVDTAEARLPRGRLRELREGAERVGRAQPCHELYLRRASRRRDVAARQHGRSRRAHEARDPGTAGEAGVEVIEARISHLAYAPEIAQAMLQRQQASAIIAARRGSSRARWAWSRWRWTCSRKREIVEFDNERKAAMVSNLLVVLCGERARSRSSTPERIYQ